MKILVVMLCAMVFNACAEQTKSLEWTNFNFGNTEYRHYSYCEGSDPFCGGSSQNVANSNR